MKSVNKETITEAALDLFLKEGFNNVTVNQICEHCDITKPTFYKYVNSKDDLILNLYDQTISNILGDTYHLLQADSHFEQLLMIFNALIQETKRFGSDLFSHMLIANLNENKHSFDMRNSLTDLCVMIIKKSQEKNEIKNHTDPHILYETLAHLFTGYETVWCIEDGKTQWNKSFYQSLIALLQVEDQFVDIYKKYID